MPGEIHGDAILVACLDHQIVSDGSARLRDVLHPASMCSLYVVTEREESIRSQSDAVHFIQPFSLFFSRQLAPAVR